MKYAQYKKLESSGVAWLQDTPSHWRIKRLKFAADLVNNKVSAEDSSLPYLGLEHIESWTGRRIEGEISNSEGLASSFSTGDVLFGKLRPYLAKVHLAQQAGLISSEALVIKSKAEVHSEFLKYYMLSRDFINIVDSSTYGSKMPRASWDFIGNLPVLLPEIEEQKAIARFLDFKTAQIDALIAKKQTLLGKLAEKRTALISYAVTKGLDPSVTMKDSGVEWLGKIPAHWDVIALRYACEFLNRRRIPLSSEERGAMSERVYPYYGASGIIDYVEDYIFNEKTILIAEDGANLLSRSSPLAFIADGKYWVNNHAHILNPIKGPFEFWANLLCVIKYDPWITGSAQPKLSKENLGGIKLPLPPRDEQAAIVRFISEHSSEIDPMATKVTLAIERLLEYRSALITNAVTGKIDVRDFSIPLPVEGRAA